MTITDLMVVRHAPAEFNYHVLLDGVPDREDAPYIGKRGGLEVALIDAHALKRANPDSTVAVQVIFES